MQDFCYYFTNPEKNYLILPKKNDPQYLPQRDSYNE